MSFLQAILMGILQGILEFLPVSSSGHIVLLENVSGIAIGEGLLFETLIHIGTLAAVIFAFKKELKQLVLDGIRILLDIVDNAKIWYLNKRMPEKEQRYKKLFQTNYRRLFLLLFVSMAVTSAVGLLMKGFSEKAAGSLLASGIGFFITGVVLLVADCIKPGNRIPKDVALWQAAVIGAFQGAAVFPGISRMGITIAVCLLLGFNRKFSVIYSFLLSVPAVTGAVLVELVNSSGANFTGTLILEYFLGIVFAALAGFLCIRFMQRVLLKKRLRGFAYYCFFIGIAAIISYFAV
ncbi:MAG TPA: undecaprenyl-diphosphate phosphatase [Candidatus Egerieimonas faecigallinarum]|nr:undecaprenyl-diphosphate phosphatase [Candidatus Egerieimonas faecigallinarum]